MSDLSRRDALKLMGLMAAASTFSFGCSDQDVTDARERGAAASVDREGQTQPAADYERQFFTDGEYETVRLLADIVIPADERSGSATDAGVPAFIDFIMSDELIPGLRRRQTAMRGGLAWMDYQCLERFERPFTECTEEERIELVDLVAYPEEAPPEMAPGVQFFSSFRDLTASGFFSSKMGVEDLGYVGNQALAEWTGCPPEVLEHVGLAGTST